MYYLLQVTVYTGLMLLLYLLLMRNKPMHSFNRFYLLAATIVPVLLPLIKLPAVQTSAPVFTNTLPTVVVGATSKEIASTGIVWLSVIIVLYTLVATALLAHKLWGYVQMKRVIASSKHTQQEGYVLVTNTNYGPGSWHKYVFLPHATVDDTILKHELAHIQLRHSADVVWVNIIQALFWPNIFIHLLKKELRTVHEFQADAHTTITTESYAHLLLNSVFTSKHFQLAHTFIHHPIKRRIMMLYKNNTNKKLRQVISATAAVLLIAGIVTLQSCEQKQADNTETPTTTDGVSKAAEPSYNVMEFMATNVKYPKDAEQQGVEGKIAVQFIIDEAGKIIEPQILNEEYNPALGQAALDAINKLPDWSPAIKDGKPVRSKFVIPVSFKMDKEEKPISMNINKISEEEYKDLNSFIKQIRQNGTTETEANDEEIAKAFFLIRHLLDSAMRSKGINIKS